MNADKFLEILQEEMSESIEKPWATQDGLSFNPNFRHERILNMLHVLHIPTGNRFEVEVRDADAGGSL